MKNNQVKKKSQVILDHILIDNFKAFGKPTRITLSPKINLIFGKNSTGKSSIIQSLRLFRQSFGKDDLTPINFKTPDRFRNLGGLDFDIGFKGLIFSRNLDRELSLGIGVDEIEEDKIPKTNFISYTYKYVENFYKGEKVKKENVILSGMTLGDTNKKNLLVMIDFPEYKLFDQTGEVSRFINRQNFRRTDDQVNSSNAYYESIHKPYYYKTKLLPKNLQSNFFNKFWENYSMDRVYFLEYLNGYYDYLKEKFSEIKKHNVKKKEDDGFLGGTDGLKEMVNSMAEEEDFRATIRKIWNNKKLSQAQRRGELNKYKNSLFYSIYKILNKRRENKMESKKHLLEVKNLAKFFNSKKSIDKVNFINFFKKDICSKFSRSIFYKGSFLIDPIEYKEQTKNTSIYYRTVEDRLDYFHEISSLILRFINNKFNTFRILRGYDDEHDESTSFNKIKKVLDKIIVVPVLRKIPKEYFIRGIQTDYVGAQGNNLAELLIIPEVKKETNKWFGKLDIPYKVDVIKSDDYYRIVWIPSKTKLEIEAQHIGLGFPMILPLIVQAIVSRNKIIVVEEPEVHLHPKLECDLADLLAESSKKYGNQFIIETHSEDLLLRLLKKVRTNELSINDISANYVKSEGKKGSDVKKININKYGQYETPWKDDLFANRLKELQ